MAIINPISTEKPVKELNDTIVPNVDKLSRSIIDGRGLARALTGDIEGAIADFQVFVEWTSNEERKAQRQEWIKAFQAGENPFTDKLLKELQRFSN